MKEKREKEMSLRKQARILGIAPYYLSMLVNRKRKWPDKLRHRYEELVNSIVNTTAGPVIQNRKETKVPYLKRKLVELRGFEPLTSSLQKRRSPELSYSPKDLAFSIQLSANNG